MLATPEINFQRTPVTLIITAIAVAIELVSTLKPEMRFAYYNDFRLGLLSYVWSGELWRPFTTALLHGSILHAVFNCYWMATLGSALERRLGSLPMLGLIVLLAYVSMMPQFVVSNYDTALDGQTKIVGLSGVVYGLFGMLWMGRRFVPEFRYACNDQTVQIMLLWFVFCVVATRYGGMPVANIAHGAGLLFGMLYGLTIFDRAHRRAWLAVAAVCTLAVLATLVYCPGHNGYEYHRRFRAIKASYEITWSWGACGGRAPKRSFGRRPHSLLGAHFVRPQAPGAVSRPAPVRLAKSDPPRNLRNHLLPARPRHSPRDRARLIAGN